MTNKKTRGIPKVGKMICEDCRRKMEVTNSNPRSASSVPFILPEEELTKHPLICERRYKCEICGILAHTHEYLVLFRKPDSKFLQAVG